jgi:hypothetical protein
MKIQREIKSSFERVAKSLTLNPEKGCSTLVRRLIVCNFKPEPNPARRMKLYDSAGTESSPTSNRGTTRP